MSRLKVIILLLFLTFVKANAQEESLEPLAIKVLAPYASITNFNNLVWQNPAMMFEKSYTDLSTIYVTGILDSRDEAYIVEQGYEDRSVNIGADSYSHLSDKIKVYGSAYYEESHNNMMVWSNNIDYSIIYPYVTADSIGGDMRSKKYFFNGGYTQQFGDWNVGGEASYRVIVAYRDKDPRPRNIVSDFNAKVGATRVVNSYIAGLSVGIRSYNQNSDVSYYADKGSTSLYHMLGLGTDYVRFSGSYDDVDFKGYALSASIDLIPRENYGLKFSVGGDYLNLTKYITNLNSAPINEIHEMELTSALSWLSTVGSFEYGAMIDGNIKNRQGQENILGDALANVYPVISEQTPFTANTIDLTASLLFGKNILENKWGWRITPSCAYNSVSQEYVLTGRFFEIANFTPKVEVFSALNIKNGLLKLSAAYSNRSNIESSYSLTGLEDGYSVKETLLKNISYLSDNYSSLNCEFGADYFLSRKYILGLSISYMCQNYESMGKINVAGATVALKF